MTTPASWNWKWLHFIRKVSSDTIRLADLRPLMLMGILRKLWSSHIGGKIMTALHKHKILDNAHHGFIAGRGTSTATLLHVNHSEDVEEKTAVSNRTSYDLSKAFDSVFKAGMESTTNRDPETCCRIPGNDGRKRHHDRTH
jgi:hypothetical protein